MKLIDLKLTNYRKFKDIELDFSDGLIGIVGPNGIGKSSLVEAIAWTIFGKDAARTDKQLIPRQNRQKGEACQSILTIAVDDKEYQIVRQITGANYTSKAAVFTKANGVKEQVAKGIVPTEKFLTNLIGLDKNSFFTSFYAKQQELNALSYKQPAERKNIILKMLGIKRIDKAVDFLRADKREIQSKIEILKTNKIDNTVLQAQAQKLEVENKEKETKLKEVNKVTMKFKQKSQNMERKLSELKKRQKIFSEQQIKKQKLESQIASEKEAISDTQKLIDDFKQELLKMSDIEQQLTHMEKLEKKLKKIEEQKNKTLILKEKESELERHKRQLGAKGFDSSTLEKKITENTRKQQKLYKQLEKIEHKKSNIEDSARAIKLELEITKQKIKELEAGFASLANTKKMDKCPLCHQALEKNKKNDLINHYAREKKALSVSIQHNTKLLQDKRAEFKKVNNNSIVLKEELDLLEKKLASHNLQKENNQTEQKKWAIVLKVIENLEDEIKELKAVKYDNKEHEKCIEQLDELKSLKGKLEHQTTLKKKIGDFQFLNKKKGSDISNLEKKLKETQEKLTEIDFDEEIYDETFSKSKEYINKLHDNQLILKDLDKEHSLIENSIKQIKEELDRAKSIKRQLTTLNNTANNLAKLDNIFSKLKKDLIGRIRPSLGKKAGSYLNELTDGKYTRLELDDNYNITIFDAGEKFPIERFSGGEEDLINLCLRLAISELLNKSACNDFNLLILDEIFGSQDATRRNNIIKALAKLSKHFKQLFIITHIDEIKDSMEYLIRLKEVDGYTTVLQN
ncbi:MAG: SMC family ATPase [Actinobacteria bacterium]|nr:MAG: SMC family ATPase [Actinomycetota bacterium]